MSAFFEPSSSAAEAKAYERLSAEYVGVPSTSGTFVRDFVASLVRSETVMNQNFDRKVAHRAILLENPARKSRAPSAADQAKKIRIASRKQARRAISNRGPIASQKIQYESLQPLNQLWRSYIMQVMDGCEEKASPNASNSVESKLLKADLHGCILTGLSVAFHPRLLTVRFSGSIPMSNVRAKNRHSHS